MKTVNQKLSLLCLFSIIGLSSFALPLPNVFATTSLTSINDLISSNHGQFFNGSGMEIMYYAGVLYSFSDSGAFCRSIDGGQSWAQISFVSPDHGASGITNIFFIDSRGYFFVSPNNLLVRSTDKGLTWDSVFNFTAQNYMNSLVAYGDMSEDDLGNLYFGVYGGGDNISYAKLYKSLDAGATWFLIKDFNSRHMHFVSFDSYNKGLYASVGDLNFNASNIGIYKSVDYGSTWTKITKGRIGQTTCALFTDNCTYFGSDNPSVNTYVMSTRDDANFGFWWAPDGFRGMHAMDMKCSPRGIIYVTVGETENYSSGVFASADEGKTFALLYSFSPSDHRTFGRISNYADGYYYVTIWSDDPSKRGILKLTDFTKDEIIHMTSALISQSDGSAFMATSPILVDNSDVALSLMQEPLRNATVKIEGVALNDMVANPSFETGVNGQMPPNWSKVDNPGANWTVEKSQLNSQFGDCSAYIKTNNDTSDHGWLGQRIYYNMIAPLPEGSSFVVSWYTKINQALPDFQVNCRLRIFYSDGSNETVMLPITENVLSWTRFWYVASISKAATTVYLQFSFSSQGEAWIDGVCVFQSPTGSNVGNVLDWSDSFSYGNTINTLNPSMVINGQKGTYGGELTNGSLTPPISIAASLAGIERIYVQANGSRMLRLIISGVKILDAHNVLLDKGQIYFGSAYSNDATIVSYDPVPYVYATPNSTITTAEASATSLYINIQAGQNSRSHLVIYSPPGFDATPDGKPLVVSAYNKTLLPNVDWMWDSSAKICDVAVHSQGNEANISVYYELPTAVSTFLDEGRQNNDTSKVILQVKSEYEFTSSILAQVNDQSGKEIDNLHYTIEVGAGLQEYTIDLGNYGGNASNVLLTMTDTNNNLQVYNTVLSFSLPNNAPSPTLNEFNDFADMLLFMAAVTLIALAYGNRY